MVPRMKTSQSHAFLGGIKVQFRWLEEFSVVTAFLAYVINLLDRN